MSVRVRFAPSPTGYLHIGGARTALFNWLFARAHKGVFILRIEDTDAERSQSEMVDGILDGLKWLGLDWDEGPLFQSQRLELYRKAAARLLRQGDCYRCFCSSRPEADEAGENEDRDHAGVVCPCHSYSETEASERAKSGKFALRLRVPPQEIIRFTDQVYHDIEVDTAHLKDFIILRSDGMPTYHLSVVVDDIEMGITHVIRGADHLSNTPKHILLFRALGQTAPVFAHLPLILGPDKKRLSKRHGATSVTAYQEQGLLPAAMRNYLALLGWSPGDDREFFSDRELIEAFDLARINKSNAVFDLQKLEWMNGKLLNLSSAAELREALRPLLEEKDQWRTEWDGDREGWFFALIELLKPRLKRLTDFEDMALPFVSDEFPYEPEAVNRFLTFSEAQERVRMSEILDELETAYRRLEPFTVEAAEGELRDLQARRGLKAGPLFGVVRVALTGKAAAPGLFETMLLLGQSKTVERLHRLRETLG